jgi:hypothetical protein
VPFNKFYENISKARKNTGTSLSGAWYRGISDGRYPLLPGLLRQRYRSADAEINIFADFWTMVEAEDITDDWERLSFMQHFGVPTRLLDWTEHLNVAVFFAVAFAISKGTQDPYIWVLNPFKLNKLYRGETVIYDAVDRIDFAYYKAAIASSFPNKFPLAMKPMWSNARVRAQAGTFTVHGSAEEPLEDLVGRNIATRVSIDHEAVDLIREKIFSEGINHSTVMGGPDGLALYLRQKYLTPRNKRER